MKIAMLPHLTHFRHGQSGIKRVVEAYFKYMPSMGIEFLEPKTRGWDLSVAHAGMTGEDCDIAILHGMYWTADYQARQWEWISNQRIAKAVRQAKKITVPSSWVAETFQRDMRISPHVVPHGIEWKDWQHNLECEKYILWNKNRDYDVCDPLPVKELAMRFPEVPFVTTFKSAGSPANVKRIGIQPHDEMKVLIQSAGVYLSSTKETFGIGTLEAMASGIPVLGFDHGGNRDLVEHGVNGYLAEPGNFDDLAEGLNFCMKNWGVLGANGRELAKKWTWENACEKMIEVWKLAMVEEEPTVSVIIPTYNYADKVGRAIESVQNQTYPIDNIFIVDDGSPDNGATKEAVEKYSGDLRIRYKRIPNSGVAIARNTGISSVGSKYVACLDADDAIEPEFIRACVEELEKDRSLGIAYTGLRWIKPDESTGISEWPGEYDYDQQIQRKNQVPTCCVYRKDMWERLGGYKSRYCPSGAGSEDAEFWTRAGALGYGAKKVTSAPLFIYSWQSGHTSQKGYSEVDWLAWHPYTRDGKHPFASVATPINKISHAVRQYDEPLVSVIIPVGPGHEDILENALDSVEAQTFRKWELIVAWDNPNFWKSNYLLKSYPHIKICFLNGQGAGAARNFGAEQARAPFLLFLDADDWLHPDCITDMLEEWRHEEAIIYSDYVEKTTVHDPEEFKASLNKRKYAKVYEQQGNDFTIGSRAGEFDYDRAIIQPADPPYLWNLVTSLVPKSWHEAIGGFDESMESWEDWDYYLRFARAGYCFRRIPKELVVYRFTTGTRRYSASADTQDGRQLAQKLIEYLKNKYREIDVVGCRCKDKKKSRPTPLAIPAGTTAKTNGSEDLVDNDFVMCKYIHPNRGQHQVIGAATKTIYGHRGGGAEFLVHKDDIAAQPHIFQAIEGHVQPLPMPSKPPNEPVPLPDVVEIRAQPPAKPGFLEVAIDEDEVPVTVIPSSELQLLPGITGEMAEELIAKGITTRDQVADLGIEGLTSIRGIGAVKAEKIIDAIVALQRVTAE